MVEGNASSPVSPGKGPSRDLALAQEAYKTSDVELMVAAHDAKVHMEVHSSVGGEMIKSLVFGGKQGTAEIDWGLAGQHHDGRTDGLTRTDGRTDGRKDGRKDGRSPGTCSVSGPKALRLDPRAYPEGPTHRVRRVLPEPKNVFSYLPPHLFKNQTPNK
jgi:hypothetical protein